jgi:hypothetical protein
MVVLTMMWKSVLNAGRDDALERLAVSPDVGAIGEFVIFGGKIGQQHSAIVAASSRIFFARSGQCWVSLRTDGIGPSAQTGSAKMELHGTVGKSRAGDGGDIYRSFMYLVSLWLTFGGKVTRAEIGARSILRIGPLSFHQALIASTPNKGPASGEEAGP